MSNSHKQCVTRAWVEQVMGMPVSVHIRAHDPDRVDIAAAVARVFEHLHQVDAVFSTWRDDSDLMRLRRGALPRSQAHPWFAEVEMLCETAVSETRGLFTTDLTGQDGSRGWDPTGLAKGWGAARASDQLRGLTDVAFSINAGGDIVCGLGRDSDHHTRRWRIGIQDPADPSTTAHVVSLLDGAIATSGSYVRGNHITDPRTGQPARGPASTTVAGPDLVWADVWATATYVDPTALDNRPDWADYALTITAPSWAR